MRMRVNEEHLERAIAMADEAMQKLVRVGIDPGAVAMAFFGVALASMRGMDGPDALRAVFHEFSEAHDRARAKTPRTMN